MNIQAKVALDKEAHPENYCPARCCLWRTGDGTRCPRHDDAHAAECVCGHLERGPIGNEGRRCGECGEIVVPRHTLT